MSFLDQMKNISKEIKRDHIDYEKFALEQDYNKLRQLGKLSDEQKAGFQKRKEDILRRERDLDDN